MSWIIFVKRNTVTILKSCIWGQRLYQKSCNELQGVLKKITSTIWWFVTSPHMWLPAGCGIYSQPKCFKDTFWKFFLLALVSYVWGFNCLNKSFRVQFRSCVWWASTSQEFNVRFFIVKHHIRSWFKTFITKIWRLTPYLYTQNHSWLLDTRVKKNYFIINLNKFRYFFL